ncbi:MAG: hypothetical protein ACTSUE_06265 [Promethearchaeota archaeon]
MESPSSDDVKINIIKEEMIREMDIGFDYVDDLMENTKKKGLFGSIMHSLEKFVFKYFARDNVRGKTIRQMDIIFESAKEYRQGASVQELGKKYFKEYIRNDETYERCHKKHAKFNIIVDNIKIGFESRIKQTTLMLERGKGTTYADIVKTAFLNKEEAIDFLSKELQCVKNEIDVLIEYPEILKVPVAKQRILEIIVLGYEYAWKRLFANLDLYYDH